MIGFKRWLAVAAVAVGFAVSGASTATAAPPQFNGGYLSNGYVPKPFPNPGPFPPRVDFDYVVIYKASIFSPWRSYGKFETYHQARYAEQRLALFGYATRIERVRDFRGGWHGW